MNACIITPTVKVGNQEVTSRLFTELASYVSNRKTAQELWALSQVKEFTENLENLEYDENGEPTFESFARAIDLDSYLEGDMSLDGLKRKAKAINKNGDTIEYKDSNEVIDNATSFNEKNPKYVASVKRVNGKYVIDVEPKTIQNEEIPQELVFNRALNNKLLGILRSVGFDVRVDNTSGYAGIFNPLNAIPAANGLRTVVQIAKGERGEKAFPEEFSHVMIAGLRNHPLVIRLLNSLDMDSVKEILGSQFESYNKRYDEDEDMLRKEAAGKLLQRYIVEEEAPPKQKNLLSRIWNWIKDKLGLINESTINGVINEANREAGELAKFVMSDKVTEAIDPDLVLQEKPLYDLDREVTSMEDMAERACELMEKRLKILSLRSKSGRYNEHDMKAIIDMRDFIEKKKYAASTLHFLSEALSQINDLHSELRRLRSIDTRSDTDLSKIRRTSFVLRSIQEFAQAYVPIIEDMTTVPAMLENGEIDIDEADADEIAEKAGKALVIINNIKRNYKKLRFDAVYNFLKPYWGEDKKIDVGKDTSITIKVKDEEGNIVDKKIDTLSLGMVMEMAFKDINGADRWISSLSDASDPMLSLVAKVVKTAHMKRNKTLNDIVIGVRNAHRKLIAAGYKTHFMYERDSNGKLTGRLISNIDFIKFNKDRDAYIESLKEQNLPHYIIRSKIESWERRHMEPVKVKGSSLGRTEMLPLSSIYGTNTLDKLSDAQREYYNTMMKLKALLEDQIPQRYANTYNAVQISKGMTESVIENLGNPKKAVQLIAERVKHKFIRRADDTEFGEDVKDNNEKSVLLDFMGNPVDKLPVYYTRPLENTETLSTDFTASIMSYASMAINYGEMNKIIDVLELTRDLIKDREVQQTSGDSHLVESFKVLHKKYNKAYTKAGRNTKIGERIDDYYEAVIYDKRKKDQGKIAGKFDTAKTLDSAKSYTGAVGLGLNLFSAIANITVGKMQLFIEAVGGEYFSLKNSIVGKKNYYKDLPAYLAEINSTQKTSKMGLLIDKFDALEEFFTSIQSESNYRGVLSRILGKGNLYILNNMGEHYLHTRTMYAMLDAYRVKKGNTEMSLYDAMKVVERDGEYSIEIEDGVTNLDGSSITEDSMLKLNMDIGKVNQSLNGAFNDDDKGAIHRGALGRMVMQFRQWMPAHYYRRYASKYYDAALDQYREGFYRTMGRFAWETLKDLRKAKFKVATRYHSLSKHEQANIKRSLAEMVLFATLAVVISMMGPAKDKKGIWGERLLLYNLKRMFLETGASCPITPNFLKNIWTTLQSPAPAIKSFNNMGDLVEFWNIFNEIESGRYKGWSQYEKDLVEVIPVYGQARKLVDISTEDYMFSIVDK